MSDPSTRQPELDGLRGVAIIGVVVYHYVTPSLPVGWLSNVVTMFARSGVDLFFVLSGYLLGGILLSKRESRSYFRTFYVRRACRILPLYLAVLAVAMIVAFSGLDRFNPVLRETLPWWSYVTFTQNILRATQASYGSMFTAATWSLAIEEQFYLVLPMVIWLTPIRRVWLVAGAMFMVSPILRLWTASSAIADPYAGAYAFTYCRFDTLFGGVLVAWMVRAARPGFGSTWLTALVCASASVVALVVWADPPLARYVVLLYSGLAVCYAALVAKVVTTPDGSLARVLRSLPLRWTGIRAYGIYLFHIAVVHGLHWIAFGIPTLTGHGWPGLGVSLVAVAATCLLAQLTWQRIERPCIEWSRRRWTYEPADTRFATTLTSASVDV